VSEEELNSLYHSALALLFPSLYEGFGFPIVEANSAGLPVIAGNNSAQVETAGEAALLVDALNTEEIAKAIIKLYQDPILRQDLREKGLVNCQRFSWRKVAEKSAEYIEEFVGSKIPVV
jgi:glycosyltransferase involved in cell wall biosynthesis